MHLSVKVVLLAVLLGLVSQHERWLSPRRPLAPPQHAVLVTGAGQGIGEAIVRRLCQMPGVVVYGTLRRPPGQSSSSSCFRPIVLPNVGNSTEVIAALAALPSHPPLWAVVNNAGIAARAPFDYMPFHQIDDLVHTNLLGPMYVTQTVLPLLKQSRGRVINIGSLAGERAAGMGSVYSATKFGLRGWSEGLRRLWQDRISVSVVEPGVTFTRMITEQLQGQSSLPDHLVQEYRPFFTPAYEKKVESMTKTFGLPCEAVVDTVMHSLYDERPFTRYLLTNAKYSVYLNQIFPDWLSDLLQIWIEAPPAQE